MSIRDYERVEQAIRFVQAHQREQPSLEAVARHVALSPYHFERLFRRWAGITPKRFLQYLTLGHARRLLAASHTVLDAAFETGLSGSSRLHDLFVAVDAVTPGEFKRGGAGLDITYGLHDSPFGRCLVASTARGVCALVFMEEGREEAAVASLAADWPGASLRRSEAETREVAQAMTAAIRGQAHRRPPLHLRGTNFQLKVWEALLRIPPGSALSYEDVAALLGEPTATRAVAGAIARNRIGVLIPCHRVLRKTGAVGGYRWGPERKTALLAWESAQRESAEAESAEIESAEAA